jgi:VanZ family protein
VPVWFYRVLFVLCLLLATAGFLAEINGHRITGGILHADKMAHFAIFGLLTALTWKAFKPKFYLAMLFLGGYGLAIELMQHYFTARQGDVWDWLADAAGIASFYLIRQLWHLWRPRSRR